jgi:hypothetical protein
MNRGKGGNEPRSIATGTSKSKKGTRRIHSLLRKQFGTAGLVLSCLALMIALGGGALAATNSKPSGKVVITSINQIKPSVRNQLKGQTGPPGLSGANGAPGKDGAAGPEGKPGKDGAPGKDGKNGKSVDLTPIPPETSGCANEQGGVKVALEGEVEGTAVCKGDEGPEGPAGKEGQPWTPNNTLPPGATETGTWAFDLNESGVEVLVPVSFPIKVAAPITGTHVHFLVENTGTCKGSALNPEAPPGELCVYRSPLEFSGAKLKGIFPLLEGPEGAAKPGAALYFETTAAPAFGIGSWAVTGCTTEVGKPFQCP